MQVDRSPCGSGVTARVAVQFHKKHVQLGKTVSIMKVAELGKINLFYPAKIYTVYLKLL